MTELAIVPESDIPELLRHLSLQQRQCLLKLAEFPAADKPYIAAQAGIAKSTLYRYLWSDPRFKQAWDSIKQSRLEYLQSMTVGLAKSHSLSAMQRTVDYGTSLSTDDSAAVASAKLRASELILKVSGVLRDQPQQSQSIPAILIQINNEHGPRDVTTD